MGLLLVILLVCVGAVVIVLSLLGLAEVLNSDCGSSDSYDPLDDWDELEDDID